MQISCVADNLQFKDTDRFGKKSLDLSSLCSDNPQQEWVRGGRRKGGTAGSGVREGLGRWTRCAVGRLLCRPYGCPSPQLYRQLRVGK